MQVQNIGKMDASVALHMRSNKYCKLRKGQIVHIPSKLIRRQSSHFIDVQGKGVQIIIGCNGWIWVGLIDKKARRDELSRANGGMLGSSWEGENTDFETDAEQWSLCARYAAAVRVIGRVEIPLHVERLHEIVRESIAQGIPCSRMLEMEFLTVALQLEEAARNLGGGGRMEF
jgi:exosome complex component RRP4